MFPNYSLLRARTLGDDEIKMLYGYDVDYLIENTDESGYKLFSDIEVVRYPSLHDFVKPINLLFCGRQRRYWITHLEPLISYDYDAAFEIAGDDNNYRDCLLDEDCNIRSGYFETLNIHNKRIHDDIERITGTSGFHDNIILYTTEP